jgi:hypothetical protein
MHSSFSSDLLDFIYAAAAPECTQVRSVVVGDVCGIGGVALDLRKFKRFAC